MFLPAVSPGVVLMEGTHYELLVSAGGLCENNCHVDLISGSNSGPEGMEGPRHIRCSLLSSKNKQLHCTIATTSVSSP